MFMKALIINDGSDFMKYYALPENYSSAAQFINHLNYDFDHFILLKQLKSDNCRAPYFIQEDTALKYVNVAKMVSIKETDVEILPRKEYEERLMQIVQTKCIKCKNFIEETDPTIKNNRYNINLDGECYRYEEK